MASALPTDAEVRALVSRVVAGLDPKAPPESPDLEPTSPSTPSSVTTTTVAVGADHGGYPLKERIGFHLKERGHQIIDCGTNGHESVDYPDFAHAVAQSVGKGDATYGIIVDGAGIGSAMVANKVPGVRAALCYDISSARNSREHNHANVLTLGAGLVGAGLAVQIVDEWLATPWAGGRHAMRIDKIMAIEHQYASGAHMRDVS